MFSASLSVSMQKELNSSNSCKRRQSEPPLSGVINDQLPRDESYVKALSKFNEWRRRQHIGGSVRLTRKQSTKLIERRGQSEQFFEKRYSCLNDSKVAIQSSKNIKPLENGLYEEIQVNKRQYDKHLNRTSPRRNLYEKTASTNRSFPVTDLIKTKRRKSTSSNKSNDTQIYENVIIDIIDQFDQSPDILEISQRYLSPPVKFFKENSNPFANVQTPIKEHHYPQDIEQSNTQNDEENDQIWAYESPRNLQSLEALRANFKPFEENESRVRKSISSDYRSNRNPPYQTVINRNGEEVEYALPFNEKLDEEVQVRQFENDSKIAALNNTSSYQQYIEDNFQFLNENDRLGLSRVSVSFSNNHFQNRSVLVTDLDGTCGTKAACDQNNTKERNTIEELEAIQVWSRNISQNIERNIIKNKSADMQFGEIIVCNTNEVSEKSPRQVFETFNGTLHSGTFHCVPVTQFKPKLNAFSESNFQLNYEVLRKIRHPDIVLLMGITVDNKCALDSLILEPLDYSLHHFIHQELGSIPMSICLLYTLQINSAVTYLHKHGLIHSNISTHSVVMCHLSKAVKLTSFELTTTTNEDLRNELMEVFQNEKYENELPTNINQLPSKLRPYNLEYRKMFSKHNHQAPELLSNRIGFVFPTIQSDVYGICLMLWEMINCSIPFAYFDYDEMAKLIYLQNAQLPMLKENRQKPFDEVLKIGLNMLAEKRFADTIELKEALSTVLIESSDDKIDSSIEGEKIISKKQPLDGMSSLLYNKGFGPLISERTSTIKKRKQLFKEDRLSAKQLFVYSQINKSHDPSDGLISSHTSSPDSSQYGFDIGEVSIPETPIARSNKLRKTAWLSNQSISPIVHLEIKSKDDDAAINQIEIVEKNTYNALKSEEDTPSNKLYNVNIRIRPNSKKLRTPTSNNNKEEEEDEISQPPIENNSLDQAHKNISQISDYIRFFNLASKQISQPIVHSPTKTQSPVENLVNYNTASSKPTQTTEKMLNQQPEPVPMDQNSLNEFFSRSHTTSDFENSLWRREKQKCDQSVRSQRRISVKDAVNKFESFSKSIISESNSPKPKRTTSNSVSSSTDEKKKVNSIFQSSKNDDNGEQNISKINIVLQNKSESMKASEEKLEAQITKTKEVECDASAPHPPEQPNQSPMLTLNFKKLDRRASDLGSYVIRQNPTTKALTARHSIYGSEIFKRLRKPKASTGNENEDVGEKIASKALMNTNIFNDKNKDFKIKVGKLTCMNCGHKLFVVDDVVHSNNEDDLNETFSELLLTPLKRNFGLQQVSKSTEDFYIDDDFCEDFELCANMELGTQTHLSDFDFDIFSAEIFNASEEKTNHIA
ncbi:uncharacterized protein LOC129944370 isoform X2 [Eupeodes corollae]|uniref:uncharacterized protein LOC129944370 isoform X2 n=1 Tax=Eupeodes corollae TaxID=290404 RepID=UPI00248F8C05|nr:uncharacterized protein LOC129944370 isoform X2 [Eupeodes corollae]